MKPTLLQAACAEVLGTFLLILFGCGAVHSAVLTGAQTGLWQVAIVWGAAIMLAAYVCGGISGAHINPAITIAQALWGRFEWSRVPAYILAQLCGAILAAAVLFVLYGPLLEKKEQEKQIKRGEMGSILTAMCYAEYYPSPGGLASDDRPYSGEAWTKGWSAAAQEVPFHIAFTAEVLGTAVLALVVFAVTDSRNTSGPPAALAPVFIGLCVATLISIIAPLTQACFNPARDFGPRLFAYFAGWGEAAIPGPNGHGFFTVYILAPTIGAIAGGGLYERVLRNFLPEARPSKN
jgi:glycerol uptake facilitator protein